uniref:Uncharacterized protein n=1 Tax=Chrysemys picta bellii TaxID=8478 RepID=A0A8C3EYK4_CHRPI
GMRLEFRTPRFNFLLYHILPCMGFFRPNFRTLHLSLLNLIRFLLAQSLNLSRSVWTLSLPSSISTPPRSLVSSANLLRVQSIPSSRSLMKMLNKIGPRTDPWDQHLFSPNLIQPLFPPSHIPH